MMWGGSASSDTDEEGDGSIWASLALGSVLYFGG